MDDSEVEAKLEAKLYISNMLQHPEQLDKLQLMKKQEKNKMSAVEAMLKTSLQSQLDSVQNGLNKLSTGLHSLMVIRNSFKDALDSYKNIKGLNDKLSCVEIENNNHCQLAAAVQNVIHIYNVPETTVKCTRLIEQGKLLNASKVLTELEVSRNNLLEQLHKQSHNGDDINTVKEYFSNVESLTEMLGKSLWSCLHEIMSKVKHHPAEIVTAIRLVERQEIMDSKILNVYNQNGFIPVGRPRKWKIRAFKAISNAVFERIEECYNQDLATHLALIKQMITQDLAIVKYACVPCFPSSYDIFNKFVEMYEQATSLHIQKLAKQKLEENEIIVLLSWIEDYQEVYPSLKRKPLLSEQTMQMLQMSYMDTKRKNLKNWMQKNISIDVKSWISDEALHNEFYETQLPVTVYDMMLDTITVGASIKQEYVRKALLMCLYLLDDFIKDYRSNLDEYKETHDIDRKKLQHYIDYLMANANNCVKFAEFVEKLVYTKVFIVNGAPVFKVDRTVTLDKEIAEKLQRLCKVFGDIRNLIYNWLLEEIEKDLREYFDNLFSPNWLNLTDQSLGTIIVTFNEYFEKDFIHLMNADYLADLARRKVAVEYLSSFIFKKLSFKDYSERCNAKDKMIKEIEMLTNQCILFKNGKDEYLKTIEMCTELIKLKDLDMIELEIKTLIDTYPDVASDHIVGILMMREDISKSNATQIVKETRENMQTNTKRERSLFSLLKH